MFEAAIIGPAREVFEQQPEVSSAAVSGSDGTLSRVSGAIEFRDVNFAYESKTCNRDNNNEVYGICVGGVWSFSWEQIESAFFDEGEPNSKTNPSTRCALGTKSHGELMIDKQGTASDHQQQSNVYRASVFVYEPTLAEQIEAQVSKRSLCLVTCSSNNCNGG